MRDRLIELLNKKYDHFCDQCGVNKDSHYTDSLADYLIENGVIVPPCRAGDTVYYVSDSPLNLSVQANTIYEADVSRIITTRYGTTLVIQIHNSYGCTEIPDVNDWGKTVFLTKEEAEQALKGGVE